MSTTEEATPERAVVYITNALTTGELVMKTACDDLGWSFPRVRSRAQTIAKKLNGIFKKSARGVYFLEPNPSIAIPLPTDPPPTDASIKADEVAAVIARNNPDIDV